MAERIKRRVLILLRPLPGNRLLLVLFAVLSICVVFTGLNDVPGYVLGYLATAVLFVAMVRGWADLFQQLGVKPPQG